MRRRLYVVLPDLPSARCTADDLLLARIEDRHMHFLARRDVDLGDLHAASFLQKSDIRHASFIGAGGHEWWDPLAAAPPPPHPMLSRATDQATASRGKHG